MRGYGTKRNVAGELSKKSYTLRRMNRSKITDREAERLVTLRKAGWTKAELAKHYHITEKLVEKYINNG